MSTFQRCYFLSTSSLVGLREWTWRIRIANFQTNQNTREYWQKEVGTFQPTHWTEGELRLTYQINRIDEGIDGELCLTHLPFQSNLYSSSWVAVIFKNQAEVELRLMIQSNPYAALLLPGRLATSNETRSNTAAIYCWEGKLRIMLQGIEQKHWQSTLFCSKQAQQNHSVHA